MRRFMMLLVIVIVNLALLAIAEQRARAQPPGGRGGFDPEEFRRRMMERMQGRGGFQGFRGGGGQDRGRGGQDRGRGGQDRGRDRGGSDNRRSSSSNSEDEYPLVFPFGDSQVLGFGINPNTLNGQVIDLEKRYDQRVLDYLDRTMERYDQNGNGIIDHEEWSRVRWRDDPRESDLDGDGRITKAEMAERLAKRNQQDDQRRNSDPRARFFGGPQGRGGGPPDRGGGGDRGGRGGRGGRDGGDRGGRGGFGGRGGPGMPGGFDPSAMFTRMDRNEDGKLEPEEVDERFRGRMYERLGLDPNQTVNLDDLRARFQERVLGRTSNQQNQNQQQKKEEEEKKARESYRVVGGDLERFKGRRSYRQPPPSLPKDLPNWWEDRDGNEDGQVTMAEFATSQSGRQLDEFSKYDINGDGVITAKEAEYVEGG